ncbi:uncharacterized protein PV09_04098 [Verruconis gallopava]|uniref:Uncharacterized protein n=1 Tax=Verruconis gallopava TaxID=253628 RepID=A0A0D2AER2_9PEZI|nr:uncharacterized protein PV09_04098 [Verruconis gallopava]KIW04930.1 hypothetical protein PV09_04098 [Verruconis gallopava]
MSMSSPNAAPVSPISEASSARGDMQATDLQGAEETLTPINPTISTSSAQMPPWLREAVAERKRQLAIARSLHAPEDPKIRNNENDDKFQVGLLKDSSEQHFGVFCNERYHQHQYVSEWLNGLPERLIEGWETVLREEVQETFGEKSRKQLRMDDQGYDIIVSQKRETFFEDIESEEFDFCPGTVPIPDGYSSTDGDEGDDDFLIKVLLGRKRLMQAEISVKRLKMGLKHVTSGFCSEFTGATDVNRTRELLAQVDRTFEEVVRKRLSNATAIQQQADSTDEQKQRYRRRLRAMRDKDPGFVLRVYSEHEITELKTMVADILAMDERNGDSEGTDWFWNMLPRLLELRGDMAEAERELARQRRAAKKPKNKRDSSLSQPQSFLPVPLSIWDLYYHQYIWMQSALNFRPIGSWYAFSIPIEDEAETEDWQLRIEQRIWLQEHFCLTLGTKRWLPFRQAMIPAY